MAQLTTLPLADSLVAKTLNARNPFEAVYDISGGYNTLTQVVNMLNPKGSKEVSTDDGKYEKAKRGNLAVVAQIASNAAVGPNLQVNFVDATYDIFRLGDTVMDSERVQGRVIAKAPGQITLEPISVTVWVPGTHFIANMYAKRLFDSSVNRSSVGKTSIQNTPDLDFNYSSITRDSGYLARRDMIDTYVKTYKGMWWTQKEMDLVESLAKQIEYKFIFSERQLKNSVNGPVNYNGGLIWSIKNRGGTYFPSSADITQPLFHDLIRQNIVKNATRGKKLMLFHGTQALFNIQQFTSDFIKYSGQSNTFGGKSVSGLDIQQYAIGGASIDFVHMPILDDPSYFPEISSITGKPRMSSTFFLLDLSPIPSVGEMGMLPAIEKFHFGKKELSYGFIPGTVGADGGDPTQYMESGKVLMVNDIDGFSCHGWTDNGIDILDAKNMTMFELTA